MDTQVREKVFQEFFSALLQGDRKTCTAIVHDLLNQNILMKDIFVNLFEKSLYRVGDLWQQHQISVAVEHLACAITERLMTMVEMNMITLPYHDHVVLVACVADEYHQLGGRMVADIFETHGWRSYFLGANTPHADLLSLLSNKNPDLVALSLSVYCNLPSLLLVLGTIAEKHPYIPVLVGGQAFFWGGVDVLDRFSNVRYISSLDELEQVIGSYET
ncbi:MAG: cobalamin-dependent protein [Methanospirillaceae archaeon]|nr:cobalamin-dependent protein [Methanospirillaceae archaeon]